ncbi:MAG TPA: hypothetical protein VH858_12730 [Hyphomicrobiales bacterium]
MSYDYAIWHTQIRLTATEAIGLYYALCEGDASGVRANRAIDAFYTELTSLYPEVTHIPDASIGDYELCPWSVAIDRSPGHLILCCVSPKAEQVGDTVRRLARKHNVAVFDPQSKQIFYPDILTLKGPGGRKLSPTLADLHAMIARMSKRNYPSYTVLEGRENDYAQAFGGGGAFTVEWREHSGPDLRHWKAAASEPPMGDAASVSGTIYGVQVDPSERLGATDVLAILEAYLNGRGRPEQYLWRDISDMFRVSERP